MTRGRAASPVTELALDIAGSCNLACRYCAEASTQPVRRAMSRATMEAAWSFLFPDGRPAPGRSFRMGSGEPMLALNLLRTLDRKIRDSGGDARQGRPHVFLTTNGTIGGPGIVDWLADTGWHVKVSLDGPAEVQDRWRVTSSGKGTYTRVSTFVSALARRMPELLSVTAVLCRDADPEEVFRAIAALGVRRIELVPAAHADPDVRPGPNDAMRYAGFLKAYSRKWTAGKRPPRSMLVRFENAVQRIMGYSLTDLPCGAGRSFFGVGPEGGLYPCFRFIGVKGFLLGRLPAGLDRAKVHSFALGPGRRSGRRAECRRCEAADICGGPCFSVAEFFGGGRLPEVHCEFVRAEVREARRLTQDLRRRDPERLLHFLPGAHEALSSLMKDHEETSIETRATR